MIETERQYYDAMRDMIQKVQAGYEPPFDADAEELEIFADCIRNGYLLGRTTYIDQNGVEQELRTMDGKMHPELINHTVPPKGLAFLDLVNLSPEEKSPASEKNEKKRPTKVIFNIIKSFFEWLATILTIIGGWSIIKSFASLVRSFFD